MFTVNKMCVNVNTYKLRFFYVYLIFSIAEPLEPYERKD